VIADHFVGGVSVGLPSRCRHSPELVCLQRTFKEYLAARQAQGQPTAELTLDGFVGKLRQNETTLKDRCGCKAVRFRVVVEGNHVTLKLVPIY
jgi:hypothetical protein